MGYRGATHSVGYSARDIGGQTYVLTAQRSPGALMDTAIRSTNGIVTFPLEWTRHEDGTTSMEVFVPDFYVREWETRLRWMARYAKDIAWRSASRSGPQPDALRAASLGDLGPLARPSFLATLGPSIAPLVKSPPGKTSGAGQQALEPSVNIPASIDWDNILRGLDFAG